MVFTNFSKCYALCNSLKHIKDATLGLDDVAESVLYFVVKRFGFYHAANEEILTNLGGRVVHPIPNYSFGHSIELTMNTVNLEAEGPAKKTLLRPREK